MLAETKAPHLTLDPQAGRARSLVAKMLRALDTSTLDDSATFLRVRLTCWHVLSANRDLRARSILAAAHSALHQRAAKIRDSELHQAFIEDVRIHREIVKAFET